MKKTRLKSLSILALMLAVSGSPVLPGAAPNDANPIFRHPPFKEEALKGDGDEEHGERPLTDLDEMITALKMVEKYAL